MDDNLTDDSLDRVNILVQNLLKEASRALETPTAQKTPEKLGRGLNIIERVLLFMLGINIYIVTFFLSLLRYKK
jgi:hypothetical protein